MQQGPRLHRPSWAPAEMAPPAQGRCVGACVLTPCMRVHGPPAACLAMITGCGAMAAARSAVPTCAASLPEGPLLQLVLLVPGWLAVWIAEVPAGAWCFGTDLTHAQE
jgi:hypothetical protein